MKLPSNKSFDFLHNEKLLTRKHVAERNRRARINYYLEEIEKLITPSVMQTSSSSKLEKAEVLERTVVYLKQHRMSQINTQQNYARGFLECIRSIQSLLVTMKVSESDVRHIFHGCLSSVKKRLQNRLGVEPSETSNVNSMTVDNLVRLKNLESQNAASRLNPKTVDANDGELMKECRKPRAGPMKEISFNSADVKTDSVMAISATEMEAVELTLVSKSPLIVENSHESRGSDSENTDTNDLNCDESGDESMWRPW